MSYQSFPWQAGDSDSVGKLCSLFLPDLKGKRVLDVGCNTGFFCGWAAYKQAAYVKGIGRNPDFLREAKKWFPSCKFRYGDWQDLGSGTYDVILFLSALHYAEDQEKMVAQLVEHLAPDGVLVLELGIAPGEEDSFVKVQRHKDSRYFPTWTKLHSMLAPYAYKLIGKSVEQAGDPLPRYVVHISRRKPLAIMLMGASCSGKSSLARSIFNKELSVISGDALLSRISSGEAECSAELAAFLRENFCSDKAALIMDICRAGLLAQFAGGVMQASQHRSFVYDGYVPAEYHLQFLSFFHEHGFYVVDMAVYSAMRASRQLAAPSREDVEGYIRHLERIYGFDEDAYLRANPDGAKAVQEGKVSSGFMHYVYLGKKEGRKLS